MNPNFAKKPSIYIWQTKISAQKIIKLSLKTFGIVITSFLINDKAKRSQYFEKTLLLANISIDVVLGILFLTLNNTKINFID